MTVHFNSKNFEHFAISIISLFLLILSGCPSVKEQSRQEVPKLPPLVRTMTVKDGSESEFRSFPVFAREAQTAKVSFRVPGQLLNFDVKIGQKVKKDDVIAELDPRDYKLAVERIEKSIEEAQAGLRAMKTGARHEDIAALEAELSAASSRYEQADRQFKRMENLRTDGTVSEVQFDVAKATRDSAFASKNALTSQLAKAKTGSREEEIEMTEAKIQGLKIDLALAKNKLTDTQLKAPFDGIVSEKFVDNHEMAMPGIPVLTLVNIENIEAVLSVSQEIVQQKGKIKSIVCEFDIPEKVRFKARIKEMGQAIQQGNLSYPLIVSFDLADNQRGRLLSGMTGTAILELSGNKSNIIVPSAALINANDGSQSAQSSVFVVESGKTSVTQKTVTTGVISDSGVEIKSGLNAGDILVIAGTRYLRNGQTIRLESSHDGQTNSSKSSLTLPKAKSGSDETQQAPSIKEQKPLRSKTTTAEVSNNSPAESPNNSQLDK